MWQIAAVYAIMGKDCKWIKGPLVISMKISPSTKIGTS